MIRINLLPYREMRRAARMRQFTVVLSGTAVIALGLIVLGYMALVTEISSQQARNQYLNTEIAKLDKDIADIKDLKQQTKDLLARKQVVESLQSDRSDAVHLLDQLVRLLPEGVFLKSIDQHGDLVHLQGFAQSSARVSTLMRNLDDSAWLSDATLIEVKAATVQGIQANEFTLDVHVRPKQADTAGKTGKPGKTEPGKAG